MPSWAVARQVRRPPSVSEGVVTAFRDGQVTLRSNRRTEGFTEAIQEHGYQGVRRGELVIHSMDGFAGAIGVSDSDGKMSPVAHIYSVREGEPRYFALLLRVMALGGFVESLAKGVRERSTAFDRAAFKSLSIPVPSPAEQRRILAVLDTETAQIDAFIAKSEELISLLTERRAATVNAPFARQTPNARLEHACEAVVDCPHTTPQVDEDGDFEAVRTASVRDGEYIPGNGLTVGEDTWKNRNGSLGPRLGDVLFTREAPAGEACMVPSTNICLGQRMVLLRINSVKADGKFLLWQLYSREMQSYFELAANGSTVTNIRLPLLRSAPIWLPSLDEQHRVSRAIGEQVDAIDDATRTALRGIKLAREHRAALISAAVTGKIDVGVAA
jgi:type I restriction enzyme, S subunit